MYGVAGGTAVLAGGVIPRVHDVWLRGGRRIDGLPVPALGEAYDHTDAPIRVRARGGRILLRVLLCSYVAVPQHVTEITGSPVTILKPLGNGLTLEHWLAVKGRRHW